LGNIYGDVIQSPSKWRDKTILMAWQRANRTILVLSDRSFMFLTEKSMSTVSFKNTFHTVFNLFLFGGRPIVQSDKGYFEIDLVNKVVKLFSPTFRNQVLFYDSIKASFWTQAKNAILCEYDNQSIHKIDTIIKDATVNQVHMDRYGTIWIGTNGNGLYRYAKQDFSKQQLDDAAVNVVSILQDKKGATWIGLLNGGIRQIYKGKESHYYAAKKAKPDRGLNIKQNTKGEIWAATSHGIALYDSVLNHFKLFSLKDGSTEDVWCIDFAKESVWAGTPNGLVEFRDRKIMNRYLTSKGKKENPVYAVYCHSSDETIYAATDDGLKRIRNGNVENINISEIGNAMIQSISLHKNQTILLGTQGAGVCIFDISSGRCKMMNTKNGLPSDLIYFAATDDQGFTWIGTEKGINRLKLNSNNEIAQNTYYGADNGLMGIETNQNAYSFGKKRYFGLVDGLYQFNGDSVIHPNPNPLHFTDIQVYYEQYPFPSDHKELTKFPSDKNHITFFFNKVDRLFSNPIQFQYYLENFDKTWSQPTPQQQSTYGNLPPGSYVFKVRAINNQGLWSDLPLEYPFVIQAPFYQTVWFALFLIGVLILLAAFFMKWQIQLRASHAVKMEQIRFQEKDLLRKELARDFHDEMGNQLTRIINYVSILKLKSLSSPEDKHRLYDKVEASAKSLYNGTRDFIWSIDPNNDDLTKVFFYIRDFADDLLKEKDISLTIENKLKGSIKLKYGASREIILIFKEGLTNIFRHASPKNVYLSLESNDGFASIVLRDDGVGFELNHVNSPNGLRNMKNRSERINADFQINSQPSGGTTILLTIPYT
jgi:signal transduction histidine kinase